MSTTSPVSGGRPTPHAGAALGHDLVVVARRQDRLEALAEELRRQHGVTVVVTPADLSKAAPRKRLVQALQASEKTVVGLCNNAGFGTVGACSSSTRDARPRWWHSTSPRCTS